MKKTFTLFLTFTCLMFSAYAEKVDETTAQGIGAAFMKAKAGKTDIQLDKAYSFNSDNGEACLYVFNTSNNGFVVVSAEDRVKPILAYSNEGLFSANDIADGFMFTMNGFVDEIEYVRNNNISATTDIVEEWKNVASTGRIHPERGDRGLAPLLETTWNQNYPYNNQCPEDPEGNGGYVYAGCVATAMGQVLKYWDHPVRGTGSHSYTPGGWGYPSYPTQTANFGQTYYNFEMMPLDLDSLSTDEEVFYIAQLLHHLGISVDMMYSGNGSGAYSQDVPDALHNYFGFTMGNYIEKDGWWGYGGYTNEEWIAALKGELDENRPIYYSGSDDYGGGGHAFVCDGYDENDYFHYNWGWSGRDDAFCAIGALNTTKYAFNQSNGAILDLYPQTENYFSRPEKISDLALTETPSYDGVVLTWTNPANDLSGNALTSVDTVFVRRNFEVVATLLNTEPGAAMSYTDLVPESRVYEYSVYVRNEDGANIPVYQKILVGEKCDLVFELNDEGGDGWKGAAISVADENGNRIGVVTMKEGSAETQTVSLLRGNVRFIWNHGWYHSSEEYDTDFECSFTIYDAEGNVVLVSPEELEDGVMLEYDNDCEHQMSCEAPEDLEGEYVWNTEDDYGAAIEWNTEHENVNYFKIYRSDDNSEYELIDEIPYEEPGTYSYYDAHAGEANKAYYYKVTAVYADGEDVCESEPATALGNPEDNFVMVEITDVDENAASLLRVYPNPTNGMVFIETEGINNVSVFNVMGQKVYESNVSGNKAVVDLSGLEPGIYMVNVVADGQKTTAKISFMR